MLQKEIHRFDIVQHDHVGESGGLLLRPSLQTLKKPSSCFGLTANPYALLLRLSTPQDLIPRSIVEIPQRLLTNGRISPRRCATHFCNLESCRIRASTSVRARTTSYRERIALENIRAPSIQHGSSVCRLLPPSENGLCASNGTVGLICEVHTEL